MDLKLIKINENHSLELNRPIIVKVKEWSVYFLMLWYNEDIEKQNITYPGFSFEYHARSNIRLMI